MVTQPRLILSFAALFLFSFPHVSDANSCRRPQLKTEISSPAASPHFIEVNRVGKNWVSQANVDPTNMIQLLGPARASTLYFSLETKARLRVPTLSGLIDATLRINQDLVNHGQEILPVNFYPNLHSNNVFIDQFCKGVATPIFDDRVHSIRAGVPAFNRYDVNRGSMPGLSPILKNVSSFPGSIFLAPKIVQNAQARMSVLWEAVDYLEMIYQGALFKDSTELKLAQRKIRNIRKTLVFKLEKLLSHPLQKGLKEMARQNKKDAKLLDLSKLAAEEIEIVNSMNLALLGSDLFSLLPAELQNSLGPFIADYEKRNQIAFRPVDFEDILLYADIKRRFLDILETLDRMSPRS